MKSLVKILFLTSIVALSWANWLLAQDDPREKSHSFVIVPFVENSRHRYYLTWASSSGSVDGHWQHDIYREIVFFDEMGGLKVAEDPKRFIGNGRDEAQEPVSAALNPAANTILSVWEDGSGSSVDVRAQLHRPDGSVVKKNWVLAGGIGAQHSPKVVHLKDHFLVVYTDEAPPAQHAMIRAILLNDSTGNFRDSLALTSPNDDNWWPVISSNGKDRAFVGWGNGEAFGGCVVRVSAGHLQKAGTKIYFENIDQYNYSLIWLEKINRFLAIARSAKHSQVCLIDTAGGKIVDVRLPNMALTRETQLAAHWEAEQHIYTVFFPANTNLLVFLRVRLNSVEIWHEVGPNDLPALQKIIWPSTGIACSFIRSTGGTDLWQEHRQLFCAFNDTQSNNAVLLPLECSKAFETEIRTHSGKNPRNFILKSAFPNPFLTKTAIQFFLPYFAEAEIHVYSIRGREILHKHLGEPAVGWHTFVWDGTDGAGKNVAAGMYFIKIRFAGKSGVRKVLRLNPCN